MGTLNLTQLVPKILLLLLGSVGLFLSAWIVIPAPTLLLLRLGVGAPEISPWLLGVNAIALLLALTGITHSWLHRIVLGFSLIALGLSALPLIQLPATDQRATLAMQQALGAEYLTQIPPESMALMRSQPFVLADLGRDITVGEVRYTPDIQFASPDGVPLSMDVYRPAAVGVYPAVIVIYGGAWRSGKPAQEANVSRYLAARGYTVFVIDYRHSPRYRYPTQLEDVQTALTFIRDRSTKYETDPTRIVLFGRSAGAHLAMLAGYQPSVLPIRAVVNYYGPVNLTSGYQNPPVPDPIDSRSVLEAFLGGTPQTLPELYRAASPITYVTAQLPPTLLIYGGRDHIVESKYGKRLGDRLQSLGNTVVFIEIPWAEHVFDAVFSGLSNQVSLYYTERFLAWALR